MINFIKSHVKIFEVALLFLLSLTPVLWLKEGSIILGHDSGFRLDPIQHLINLFYSWDPSSNFGTDWSLFKGFIITQAPETFFITLTKSFAIGQQLTFIFWFFCIGISMYAFINAFFKEKDYWFFRVFASTFYMYNFFLLQAWFIAERAKFSLFCALPLGVLFIYKTLTREYSILKGVILFSLMSFLFNAGGNPTFYGALLLVYGITFIYLTAANVRARGYGAITHSFKAGILFAVGFLIVNAYWTLPQLYSFLNGYGSSLSSIGGIESIIGWESVITKNASFLNLFRLEGIPDWYDNNSHTYAYFFTKFPPIVILSFIPLFILLFGLMSHRKIIEKGNNKLIILILLFFLFGLFFTAGSHPPLGNIYVFLIKFVPGFAIFRSAFYKFGGILWFSYIFLIGLYLNLLLLKLIKRKKMYIFLSIFSLCFLLVYHFPFFNGNFFMWNDPFTTQVKIPSYVNDMAEYINKSASDTRILLLPEFDNQADSYEWGFWGIDSLPRLITNKSIVANSAGYPEIVSSIYNSISQNDENTFLRLTGIPGINKILWRDDVLYSDKARTSKDFISIKENLEGFRGIKLEKKVGNWSLYQIESAYYAPIFHSVDKIVYAQSDSSKLRSIFKEEEGSRNLAIFFDESMKDKNKEILLSSNKNVIGADCIACGSEAYDPMKGGLEMPKLKLLPSSPFYYLSFLREQQVKQLHKNNPSLRIDADLGYSSKRIVEMRETANAKVKDKNNSFFVNQAIGKYKLLIKDALEQASMLSEDKENEAFMKINIYLVSQFYYLSLQRNLYDYALEDFEQLSNFMQDTINYVQGKIWTTDYAKNQIRYFLNVDREGLYDLNITSKAIDIRTVAIDGKNLTKFENIYFSKGLHKLALSYPVVENLIDISAATQSGELRLPFGSKEKFPVKKFDLKEIYFVNFDYKISKGRPNASIIQDVKNRQFTWFLFLNQNNIWNVFSAVFMPNQGTTSITLEFYPTGFETGGATIEIKDFKFVNAYVPEIFISKKVPVLAITEPPKISFDKLNPAMYKANVENSTTPFVLGFGESYNKDWRAYIAEDFFRTFFTKPIPESQHYTLNGYSNGWLIDKKGSYTIIVEYFPQKIFYIGVLVSVVSLFIAITILLRKKGNI